MGCDVLVVRRRPTGLVLALCLTKLGTSVRLLDKTVEPGTTSRPGRCSRWASSASAALVCANASGGTKSGSGGTCQNSVSAHDKPPNRATRPLRMASGSTATGAVDPNDVRGKRAARTMARGWATNPVVRKRSSRAPRGDPATWRRSLRPISRERFCVLEVPSLQTEQTRRSSVARLFFATSAAPENSKRPSTFAYFRCARRRLRLADDAPSLPFLFTKNQQPLSLDRRLSRRGFSRPNPAPARGHLHDRSGCFRLERSPGGSYTRWKAPPSVGGAAVGKAVTNHESCYHHYLRTHNRQYNQ